MQLAHFEAASRAISAQGASLPAAAGRVAAHLVAHLTQDAKVRLAGGGLRDQTSDLVGGRHRKDRRD